MSLQNISSPNTQYDLYGKSIDIVFCSADTADIKTLGCGEIIADNLYTRNDDTTLTRLNTPSQGVNNQVLKTNGDGTVYWDNQGVSETYLELTHSNLTYNAGINGPSDFITTNTDRKYICSKNGNFRNISGEIDVKIAQVNGYDTFTLSFDLPYGEIRKTNNARVYGTCIGYSSSTTFMFNSIAVSSNTTTTNRIAISLRTVNFQNWTQTTTLIVRVMYNLNYLVND
jgi:hypothetical protein